MNTSRIKLKWLIAHMDDVLLWPVNFIRDLPRRIGRLSAALGSISRLQSLGGRGYWLQALAWYTFDLMVGPEIVQLFLRMATDSRSLSSEEIAAAKKVLGHRTIRYYDVRIATGGILHSIFSRNKNRAFATWHTINLPSSKVSDISLLVHELIHVYQYERIGSVYITQGLGAQRKLGRKAYDYGGAAGLMASRAAGKRLRDYNREQQGQIAQDYTSLVLENRDTEAYGPFIEDLRQGLI